MCISQRLVDQGLSLDHLYATHEISRLRLILVLCIYLVLETIIKETYPAISQQLKLFVTFKQYKLHVTMEIYYENKVSY